MDGIILFGRILLHWMRPFFSRNDMKRNKIAVGLGFFLLVFILVGYGCSETTPECNETSDCNSSHYVCKDGKCIHDHSHDTEQAEEHSHTHEHVATHEHNHKEQVADAGVHETGHHEHMHDSSAHEVAPVKEEPAKEEASSVGELERCDPQRKCGAGLSCVTFASGATEGLCLRSVVACTGTSCKSGEQCVTLEGGGVCLRLCSQSAPCPNNLTCSHLHFPGGHGDACTP
ncbi:MAG TPA: hypothetical protein DCE42_24525 [Myxococcales bacterium]|nr:hypothetical protein [Myxococcales bacterium]